ncbi:MAG: thermonuclease family protein [Candidatus Pacearchaeota archaeon]|jgi:endonuclease YncB( thermonuclease family)
MKNKTKGKIKSRKYRNQSQDSFKNILSILLFFFLLAIVLFLMFYSHLPQLNINKTPSENLVVRVIDGDTIEMGNGNIVRLICIDSPELNTKGSYESKEYLESLILNKEVILKSDVSDKDKFGRDLRYVYITDSNNNLIFINKEIVKNGHATLFRVPPDISKCEEIIN